MKFSSPDFRLSEYLQSQQLAGSLSHDGAGEAGPHHHQVVFLLQPVHPPELLPAHTVPVLRHVVLVPRLPGPQLLPLPLVRLVENDLVV